MSPILAAIVTRANQPLLQSISDMEAPQLVFGRVALLGNSAFVARPHVVAGTTKAALDAKGLADALDACDGNIDMALERYERERREFGHAIVAHSRYLGAYLEAQLKPVSERSGVELHRDPKQVMREYGAPHLVHDVNFTQLDE